MRVLLVEDDRMLLNVERGALVDGGYLVDAVGTAGEALALASQHAYDGIVLDLTLPDATGLDVLRTLRGRGIQAPVLFLTGQGADAVIVKALNAGADDYVVKPITVEHLLARVRSLVRRGSVPQQGDLLTLGNVRLSRLAHSLCCNQQPVPITHREYTLLEYFLLRPDVLVTRSELLDQVWGLPFDPGTNLIDVQVGRVRKLLRHAGADVTFVTRRGRGFVLQLSRPPGSD